MEKYKIKRNPKPISEEQIKRHQDFDKLMVNHQKLHRYKDATKPLYKNSKFMGFMVLIGIVVLLLVFNKEEKEIKSQVVAPVVKSDSGFKAITPITDNVIPKVSNDVRIDKKEELEPGLTNVYETFTIRPENGAVLYLTTGIRILVPVNAFLDHQEMFYKKEVLLKVRSLSSLAGLDIKTMPNFTLNSIIELKAEEANGGGIVTLARPITIELVTEVAQKNGKAYHYETGKENWNVDSEERRSYRFLVNANESEYPAFISFKDCVWEFTEQTREVTDFNYVFNRSWEKISFFDSNYSGLLLTNTNSSFKARIDIVPLVGDKGQSYKLRNAFFTLYNQKGIEDADKKKEAYALIEKWKNSEVGLQYTNWLSKFSNSEQFYSDKKISTFTLSSLGYFAFSFDSKNKNALQMTKRVLVLSKKKQDRNQLFSEELIKNEPTLKR